MTKGLKTPAFWLGALATAVAAAMGAGAVDGGMVGAGLTLMGSALGAAGYTTWRSFKKAEAGAKAPWKTSEFWLTLATAMIGGLTTFGVFADGSLGARLLGLAAMVLSSLGYAVKPGPAPAPKA